MDKACREKVDVRYYAENGILLADDRIAKLCRSIKTDGSLADGAREAQISYSK